MQHLKHDQQHYQQKLQAILDRNLSWQQRLFAGMVSILYWILLYAMVKWIYHLWVPYVVAIQKFSHLSGGYLTYFLATLFILVWLYLLYRVFQQALKYLIRTLSGVKEKTD